MKRYRAERVGSLLLIRGALQGPGGTSVLRLLVDTGASYTVVPVEALEAIGCAPPPDAERVRMITGSGIVVAPRTPVSAVHVLGAELKDFPVVAYTLPFGFFDGLLGMDVLSRLRARLDIASGEIALPTQRTR